MFLLVFKEARASCSIIAAIAAANQAMWLKKLMNDQHAHQEDNIEIFVDNQATLAIS